MTLAPYVSDWLMLFTVSAIAIITPGPDFAVILRTSLGHSRRAGIYTAVGIALGLMIHGSYSVLGVGILLAQSATLFSVVKWLGAGYLVWLGMQALRSQPAPAAGDSQAPGSGLAPWGAFRAGFLTNLLNPKAPPFFLAVFTQVVRPGTPQGLQALYGVTIVITGLAWFALLAWVVSSQRVRRTLQAGSHWLERATGVVLIGLGLRLALLEFRGG
ncbi:MAG: LysE family transporter [Deltaproteobacteria bacterium]|nr:LysE family transporter [Deltaproteobacteria bacterium]